MTGLDTLRDSLTRDIERFDVESGRHKRLHRRGQVAVIALTALTTVVAGAGLILPATSGRAIQFTVLCLTAVTAAVTAWSEMRRARELWQHEREVYYALLDIRRELEFFATTRTLAQPDLDEYFRRIGAVLGSSTQKWARIQEKQVAAPVAQTGD